MSDDGPGVATDRQAVIFDTFQAAGVARGVAWASRSARRSSTRTGHDLGERLTPRAATFTAVLPYG